MNDPEYLKKEKELLKEKKRLEQQAKENKSNYYNITVDLAKHQIREN